MVNKNGMMILSNLRNNGREKLTNIAKKTKIPISTIFDKIRTYEKNLVIKKHSCLLNFSKLGYDFDVCLLIKTNKDEKEKLKEFLLTKECINTIFKTTTCYDFFVEGIFRDMQELHDFIDLLENEFSLVRNDLLYVIGDLKREDFLNQKLEVKDEPKRI